MLYEDTCIDLGLDHMVLEEAGGVVSWLKRAFSNVDNDLVSELRVQMQHIKTHYDKRQALVEIDKFIEEATMAERGGTLGDLISSIGIGTVGGVMGAAAGSALGAVAASKIAAPDTVVSQKVKAFFFQKTRQSASDALAAAENTANTATHKMAQHDKIVSSLISGMAALSVASMITAIVIKSVYRYSGSLEKYVAALHVVRDEIAEMKVR